MVRMAVRGDWRGSVDEPMIAVVEQETRQGTCARLSHRKRRLKDQKSFSSSDRKRASGVGLAMSDRKRCGNGVCSSAPQRRAEGESRRNGLVVAREDSF